MAPASAYGISGTYNKDKARSEPNDRLMDKLDVGWLLKKAAGLMTTLKFDDSATDLIVTIKAGGIFDNHETWSYVQETEHPRRDKKPGILYGKANRDAERSVTVRSHWDAPHPGSAVEKYIVDEVANEMLIDTQIAFKDGENIKFKQIYTRKEYKA